MGMLHEADIVARTLINVLDPSQEQRSVCLRAQRTRYKARRVGLRQWNEDDARARSEPPTRIAVMERLSLSMITVSWSDSCSGRYAEQIWCRSRRACRRSVR